MTTCPEHIRCTEVASIGFIEPIEVGMRDRGSDLTGFNWGWTALKTNSQIYLAEPLRKFTTFVALRWNEVLAFILSRISCVL
jgi:hypothetical protein